VVDGTCPPRGVGPTIHDDRGCCPCCSDTYSANSHRLEMRSCATHGHDCEQIGKSQKRCRFLPPSTTIGVTLVRQRSRRHPVFSPVTKVQGRLGQSKSQLYLASTRNALELGGVSFSGHGSEHREQTPFGADMQAVVRGLQPMTAPAFAWGQTGSSDEDTEECRAYAWTIKTMTT
jgi:hypothetical protein